MALIPGAGPALSSKNRQFAKAAYLWACDLELRAVKPGNVGDHADGHQMTPTHFRESARASADPLSDDRIGLGERIYRAVEVSLEVAGCNTNLGILLLSGPLIAAYLQRQKGQSLEQGLKDVLKSLGPEDAVWVFKAISRASPGGLGEAPFGDVRNPPPFGLLEAMALADERDSIARQYTYSFKDIFHKGIPLYDLRLSIGDSEEWATAAVFIDFLSRLEDSHVRRKFGQECAGTVSREASRVADLFGEWPIQPELVLGPLLDLDRTFKARGINPGTTADLTVATLLGVALNHRNGGKRGKYASL